MGIYTYSEEELTKAYNFAKEATIQSLLKEGLISQQNADYFREHYCFTPRHHETWGWFLNKVFKGPDKERMTMVMVKVVDPYNESKAGVKPSHAKVVPLKKEKEDAGAERFQDIGDDGGSEGTT